MQDFWLLNGFFLALGLTHIIVALIFIFRAKPRNLRNRSELTMKQSKPTISKKMIGYNLLVTGLLISLTATLILILGQSINLLVLAAINLAVTFLALRLNLFDDAEIASMKTINTNENEQFSENLPSREISREMISSIDTLSTEIALITAPSESVNQSANQTTTAYKPCIEIAPDLLAELTEISSDPTATVDEAIRWWLRRRLVDDDSINPSRKSLRSNESWRAQQQSWND